MSRPRNGLLLICLISHEKNSVGIFVGGAREMVLELVRQNLCEVTRFGEFVFEGWISGHYRSFASRFAPSVDEA